MKVQNNVMLISILGGDFIGGEREFGGEMTRYRWSIETLSSLTPRVTDGAVEGSSNF